MSRVSIVMPVYNGIHFIEESIESIQNQTFRDWEFIIVNEFGSDDGSREIIEKYANADSRIKLLQNTEKLGLAESLNQGIAIAGGEYIARVDVDDPSYPERLQKQVEYLDIHKDITLCGTIQRSVTPTGKNIQRVSTDVETLRASMLFGCEISHCSVMFRKSYFIERDLKYDANALSEDYDLWMKILFDTKIANLDEVLVDHRWGFENISIQKGERLREASRNISKNALLKYFDIDIEKEQIDQYLLSGWNSKPTEYARKHREQFLKDGYRLLNRITKKNAELSRINPEALEQVLARRWDWICECCGIEHDKGLNVVKTQDSSSAQNPLVSVVLPVYNSAVYLGLAIDSILAQSYSNWELLLINEYGSDDGSIEICKRYEKKDSRIHLLQNEKVLGLGSSLNRGFKAAKGKYIARLDADDLAHPNRFEKQVFFLEKHPDIGICGSWQHHFGSTDWIHKTPETPEQCKANLLFWCDLCHSTLMLRKSIVEKYDLYFDSSYKAEDFELWTRALRVTKIANIPEVLGEYRCSDDNITNSKWEELREESGHIVARQLQENLGINLSVDKHYLLNGWGNIYTEVSAKQKEDMLNQLKDLIFTIWEKNKKVRFYGEQELLTILNSKWNWAKSNRDWHNMKSPYCIERIFDEHYPLPTEARIKRFLCENKGLKARSKKCIKYVLRPLTKPFINRIIVAEEKVCSHVNNITWKRTQYVLQKMDARIWKAEQEVLINQKMLSDLGFQQNRIPFKSKEKIRIVFLFQVASFWPAIEPFYESVSKDDRFEVILLCYDEEYDKTIKVDTSRQYLLDKGIHFEPYEEFDIDTFCPHIVVMQTPYDTNRAQRYKTNFLKSKGYRIVYIPYGIEIAATNHAKRAHFSETVVLNCWRLYTLSETMRHDYFRYCPNATAVRAIGLPRFDSLYRPEKFPLSDEIRKAANGRKIVLWKVHFPKVISEKGKNVLVTPYIEEYILFAKKLCQYKEFFFIFMPHPRFEEFNDDIQVKSQIHTLMDYLKRADNLYIDIHDDYRNSLINADYIIIDRSAVMVEAGSIGVPVLYMYNPNFNEPLTKAIAPLIDSYYQGTTCKDMENFIKMCQKEEDPLQAKRQNAFSKCIPYFDGKCAERIKNDLIQSLEAEQTYNLKEHVDSLNKTIDSRIWRAEQRLQKSFDEVHTQIDFSYRDIMIVLEKQLNFIGKHNIILDTKYPCAFESNDHKYPRGTVNDNTRYPRFIKKCESIFNKDKDLKFLDLGCSGGGMVLDAIIRGHLGIGLEGSDRSLITQRAEWRLLRDNLFTCDITKPFLLIDQEKNEIKQFDVITAWEVLEHIKEGDLEQLFDNIRKHLSDNGIFVGSIAAWDDIDPDTGINWHVTVKDQSWWEEKFNKWGFEVASGLMEKEDLARGGINHPIFYKEPSESSHKDEEFFVVLTIAR